VRQSGGFVRLESVVGVGTTVRIFLPRYDDAGEGAAGPPEQAAAQEPPAAADAVGGAVLVVEDEAGVRAQIVEALNDLDCRVREAEDAAAGLRILRSGERIDMIVTDVGLPGLNGRQLADAAREIGPNLPVLLITGYAGADFDKTALPPGMEILSKPFDLAALAARVRAMLDAARASRRAPSHKTRDL
jgi:CheY-like chemotaxis protein